LNTPQNIKIHSFTLEQAADWLFLSRINGMTDKMILELTETYCYAHEITRFFVDEMPGCSRIFYQAHHTLMQWIEQNSCKATANGSPPWQITPEYLRAHQNIVQLAQAGITLCTPALAWYPHTLRHSEYRKGILYCTAKFVPQDSNAIAIVGTRRPSPYGIRITQAIVQDLQCTEIPFVSGMAQGIDRTCHSECIQQNLRTIAVLGQGFLVAFSKEDRRWIESITKHGVVCSQFDPLLAAKKETFPQRNAVISGMSRAIVLAESKATGGGMITAQFALREKKPLFAVPGRIDDPTSSGPNILIAQKHPCTRTLCNPHDILPWLGLSISTSDTSPNPASNPKIKHAYTNCNPQELAILQILEKGENSLDGICVQCSLPFAQGLAILAKLEFRNLVQSLPGRRFCLQK
jgi:DNA processing protein